MDAYSGIDSHSSPRTRRYFPRRASRGPPGFLFSAHAEVFPFSYMEMRVSGPLLRARGGISRCGLKNTKSTCSSPRTRRYFHSCRRCRATTGLFSAHAEVFPKPGVEKYAGNTLLRARGGISYTDANNSHACFSSPHTRRYFPIKRPDLAPLQLFSAHAEVFP